MRRFSFLFILLGIFAIFSCNSGPTGEKAKVTEAKEVKKTVSKESYKIDGKNSMIYWEGSKPTGNHTGTLGDLTGSFSMSDGMITEGKVTANLLNLKVTDIEDAESRAKLEGHLKSPDFFDTNLYPISVFTVTSCEAGKGENAGKHIISGNLKIQDKAKNISFPATITDADNAIMIKSEPFTINRTDWGLTYGSGTIGTVQDKLIHDEIGLQVNISASKK